MCFDEHTSTILSLWQVAEDQEHNTAQLMSYLLHLMSSIGAVHLFNEVIALTQSVGFKYTVETSGRVVKHSCALSQALVPPTMVLTSIACCCCLVSCAGPSKGREYWKTHFVPVETDHTLSFLATQLAAGCPSMVEDDCAFHGYRHHIH